jgi:hypothetical protein
MAVEKPEKTQASRVVPETSTVRVPAASVSEPFTRVKASWGAPDATVRWYIAPNPSEVVELALISLAPALTATFQPL